MSTKKVNGTLIGDHEVIGSVDNVWIDTSNPNKILTKVFVNGAWKTIADSAAASEAIAAVEEELANKTNKVSEATDGNLAALNSSGDLTDSGKSTSDFMSAATNTGSDGQILEFTSSGPQWADAPEGTVVVDSAMSDSSTNAVQNKVIKEYVDAADALKADKTALDDYALKTGSYDTLTAGMAKNIEGQSTSTGTFLERTTANALDVANGAASVKSVKGHSVVWNQQVVDNKISGSVTHTLNNNYMVAYISTNSYVFKGHKVFVKGRASLTILPNNFIVQADNKSLLTIPKTNLVANQEFDFSAIGLVDSDAWHEMRLYCDAGLSAADGCVLTWQNLMCIDLTLIFGVGNEPTTVAEFESWLEQNVGLKPYYAYDAGSILNNKMTGIKTIGRNLLDPTTKTARLISYSYSDNSNKFCIKDLPTGATLSFTPDATGVSASVTPDANGVFTISGTGTLTVTTDSSLADTYLCYVWDGTMNDESVAYDAHTYPLDVTKIYGKLNGEGDYVQVFPNGMLSAGSVKDVLTKDSAVVNVAISDFKDLYFTKNIYGGVSRKGFNTNAISVNRSVALCSAYVSQDSSVNSDTPDKTLTTFPHAGNGKITIIDETAYDNYSAVQYAAAMEGTKLVYQLSTPLTYTNLVYRDNGVDTPFSLPNILVDNWSTEQAEVTAYSSNAPTSCASTLELLYGVDVANFIDSANNGTFISEDSMDAFLSALGTAMGGTWSKTWDSTNGKWGFTFTATSNFLSTGVGANGTWGVDDTDHTMVLTPASE